MTNAPKPPEYAPYRSAPKPPEYRVTYASHSAEQKLGEVPMPQGDGWELHSWKVVAATSTCNDLYFLWRRDPP